jgi:hypothetical protein
VFISSFEHAQNFHPETYILDFEGQGICRPKEKQTRDANREELNRDKQIDKFLIYWMPISEII